MDIDGTQHEDVSHLVVLDNLISWGERQQILDFLTEEGWDHKKVGLHIIPD